MANSSEGTSIILSEAGFDHLTGSQIARVEDMTKEIVQGDSDDDRRKRVAVTTVLAGIVEFDTKNSTSLLPEGLNSDNPQLQELIAKLANLGITDVADYVVRKDATFDDEVDPTERAITALRGVLAEAARLATEQGLGSDGEEDEESIADTVSPISLFDDIDIGDDENEGEDEDGEDVTVVSIEGMDF